MCLSRVGRGGGKSSERDISGLEVFQGVLTNIFDATYRTYLTRITHELWSGFFTPDPPARQCTFVSEAIFRFLA